MKIQRLLISACILLLSQPVLAMTLVEASYVCPIGGEAFTQTVPASGTSFGKRTDLKPIGPISAPWTIPQCPTNKFVMFKDDFTPEELKNYSQIINSEAYKAIPKDSSEYYYLAKLLEGSNESSESIAWAYLRASWEMDSDVPLKNALLYFKKSLDMTNKTEKSTEDNVINSNLMVGELNRLLGNFNTAKQHFETLKRIKFYSENPYIMQYIDLELKLIEEKNSNPETIDQSSM